MMINDNDNNDDDSRWDDAEWAWQGEGSNSSRPRREVEQQQGVISSLYSKIQYHSYISFYPYNKDEYLLFYFILFSKDRFNSLLNVINVSNCAILKDDKK